MTGIAGLQAQGGVDRTFGSVERSLELDSGPLGGRTVRYRVLAPYDLEEDEQLPVLLFLHGAGERGDDNLAQLRHLPERFAREDYRARFRGIVVAPQCPRGTRWVDVDWSLDRPQPSPAEPSPWLDVALRALDATLEELPCDPDRVYLSGLSMGGFGAWHLAARAPERFAAVLPVCGGGDPAQASRFVDLPVWAWHGAHDHVVAPIHSRAMVAAVRAAGGIAHYTELPRANHDAWSAAYAVEGGALDWLWQQRRDRDYHGYAWLCDHGGDRVLLRANDPDPSGSMPAARWSWSGVHDEDPAIREAERSWFADPTDARSTALGTTLWICSAAGGVARIRVADRRVTYHAFAEGGPTALAPLADGSVAVACADSGEILWYLPPTSGWSPLDPPLARFPLAGVRDLAAGDEGASLCAVSGNGEVLLCRIDLGRLREFARADVDRARFVAHDPSGSRFLLGTARGLRWLDPETLETSPCDLLEGLAEPDPRRLLGAQPIRRPAPEVSLLGWSEGDPSDPSRLWILAPESGASLPCPDLELAAARPWN